ncbi:choice-of-anchor Q domain-containing protein [Roseibacillus persicicus]|uniref:choice-of-anchor Q domain-containing protein n=1 Tax=Roseibacillus persicicus TaxID=454148 RepID=UPI00398B4122
MNKHSTPHWRSPSINQSAGRQRRQSFFLWIRDRAIKEFHQRGGLALSTAAVMIPAAGQAANFTVDTLSDVDADGATLREAVLLANATTEADTISFAPELAGTLTLTQGEIFISEDLAINGPQERITISGDNQTRHFYIPLSTVSLSNLNLIDGDSIKGGALEVEQSILTLTNCDISNNVSSANGGAINSERSELTLTNCSISDNSASGRGGGIFAYGTRNDGSQLILSNCEVSGNTTSSTQNIVTSGGGIATDSLDLVNIENSLLSGNSATSTTRNRGIAGGLLSNSTGELLIENSTFVDNNSSFFGGAISSSYSDFIAVSSSTISNNVSNAGSGIAAYGCTEAVLTNCTIIGNSTQASGGGIYSRGTNNLHVQSCSVTANSAASRGGGVYAASTGLNVGNSIVAFNNASTGSTDLSHNGSRALVLGSPNLFSSAIGLTLPGDQIIETDAANVFATTSETNGIVTGTLADNGGPVSTLLILQGGVAENAGDNGGLPADSQDLDNDSDTSEALPVDARGYPRVADSSVDLGAVEFTASYDLASGDLVLSFTGIAADGSAVLSFTNDREIAEGEAWVVSRSTDLNDFVSIFTFDGATVVDEEAGNSSDFDPVESIYTITDTAPPSPKAFYKLEIKDSE